MNERSENRTPRLAPTRRPALIVIVVGFVLVCYGAYWAWNHYQTNSRYQTALQTVERRDWKRAREQLKELIQQSPTPDHYLLAARTERRLENLGEAKKLLDLCQRRVFGARGVGKSRVCAHEFVRDPVPRREGAGGRE